MSCTFPELNARVRATQPDFSSPELDLRADYADEASNADESHLQQSLLQLKQPYPLSHSAVDGFRARRYVRLRNVLPPDLLRDARARVVALARGALGGRDPSVPARRPAPCDGTPAGAARFWARVAVPAARSWNIQMVWAVDPVVRALVLSPRVGDIVCRLLGCSAVRLYHDNFLSRAPGSKRTLWHCDDGPDGYMPMAGEAVTVWFPLHRCSPSNGSLVFPHFESKCSLNSWDVSKMDDCPSNEQSDEYDMFCAKALEQSGATPSEATYEMGDLSVHATGKHPAEICSCPANLCVYLHVIADCFHSTGPNMTGVPRMIFGVTYFADGTTMRTDKDPATMSRGQQNDWKKFAPGECRADLFDPHATSTARTLRTENPTIASTSPLIPPTLRRSTRRKDCHEIQSSASARATTRIT